MRTKNLGAFEFPKGPKVKNAWKLSLMARSGGYVMVRHPHCIPHCISEGDWIKLPDWQKPVTP